MDIKTGLKPMKLKGLEPILSVKKAQICGYHFFLVLDEKSGLGNLVSGGWNAILKRY